MTLLFRSKHNYRRITRILKSLGELGLERFQAPWVEFIFLEILKENQLQNLRHGPCLYFWLHAIRDQGEQFYLYSKYGRHIDTSCVDEFLDSDSEEDDEEIADDTDDAVSEAEGLEVEGGEWNIGSEANDKKRCGES